MVEECSVKNEQGKSRIYRKHLVTSATTKSSYKIILQKLMEKRIIFYEILCLVNLGNK